MQGISLNNISALDKFRRDDCNLVYLFTNARDEPHIAECVAHHLLLGFDRIHIFDHKSVIPISQKLGTTFNRVTVERVENIDGKIKLNLIKRAVDIATKKSASWRHLPRELRDGASIATKKLKT